MNTIYAYTTKTYAEFRGWLKVGQTKLTGDERINQQDGTSNPEPLLKVGEWKVTDKVTDKKIHHMLKKLGKPEVREDKKREWFACTIEDVSIAINYLELGISRPNSYKMREEQQDCVNFFAPWFLSGGAQALLNAKMRFGKTFVSYQIAKACGFKDILILTHKPQVGDGWIEDLESHVDFDGWAIHQDGFDYDPQAKVNVVFASFQNIGDLTKKKFEGITDHQFDLLIIDETHYGAGSEKSQAVLARLKFDHVLYLSGTPLKLLMSGKFSDEEIYSWTYADEQAKRKLERETCEDWNKSPYRWLPEMHIHTYEVCDEAKRQMNQYSDDEQFTMHKMFSSDDGNTFNDVAAVNYFLDQIFGVGYRKTKSPLRQFHIDHMLWVMPADVKSVAAMCALLQKRVGDDYRIINASADNERDIGRVRNIIDTNKRSITVSCGRFNTGVTVKKWDGVFMFDGGKSAETYFQTIFRCQSADKDRHKEVCRVFDFNPQRLLEVVYIFSEITAKKNQSTQAALRQFLEFAPILDHSDNEPRRVNTEEVLAFMSAHGDYAASFGSSQNFDVNKLLENANRLISVNGETKSKKEKAVSDNGVQTGKTHVSTGNRTSSQPKQIDVLKELREKAITVLRNLPYYLYIDDDRIESIEEIVNFGDRDAFATQCGMSVDDFVHLCENGTFHETRINRSIMAFRHLIAAALNG